MRARVPVDVVVERPLVELQGDALDLLALVMVVGYGEVGHRILSNTHSRIENTHK